MESLLAVDQEPVGWRGAVPGSVLVSLAVDWLTAADEPPRSRRRGDEVTAEVTGVLAGRIEQLRRLDDTHGSLVAGWMMHDLRWAVRLARTGSYDAVAGARLYRAIADLAQLVGWLLVDLGQRAHGQRYLLAGLRAASVAGDRDLGAHILSCLSYHLVWDGNGRDALRLIKIARQGARDSAGAVGSLLATRQARAHASLGQDTECRRALAEAAAAFAEQGTAPPPPWSSWVSVPVLEAAAGRARLDLGDLRGAEEHLVAGIRQLGQDQRRNRLLHTMSVAEARLARGELDGAADSARAALELHRRIESSRARRRLLGLRASFARHDAVPARQVSDEIDQSLVDSRMSRFG